MERCGLMFHETDESMAGLIQKQVTDYYTRRIREHGPCASGVDWNSPQSQELRFEQLLRVIDERTESLLDYGCGYGALIDALERRGGIANYQGFDLSAEMVAAARSLYADREFVSEVSALKTADVSLASGVFNVKMTTPTAEWEAYVLDTIQHMNALSRHGFAFNLLTSYSDQEFMRDDLYYGDPCFYFDFCKRYCSRHVALQHDYGLYEFTILVRK